MTDFIHEPPKKPQENRQPAYVPPKTEKERQKKVYAYILVLFCVAMLLLLWSSMMTNRSNQKTLSELKESTYTLQSITESKDALEKELAETQKQLETVQKESSNYEEAAKRSEKVICAMEYLCEIEREYASDKKEATENLIKSFEGSGLKEYLPTEALHGNSDGSAVLSPAEAYRTIVEELFPNGVND